jgi:hypothetical protein
VGGNRSARAYGLSFSDDLFDGDFPEFKGESTTYQRSELASLVEHLEHGICDKLVTSVIQVNSVTG